MCNLRIAPSYGFIPKLPNIKVRVECEGGEVVLVNYMQPTFYHYLEVAVRDGEGGKGRKKRVEKIYSPKHAGFDWKGEEWWTTCVFPPPALVFLFQLS